MYSSKLLVLFVLVCSAICNEDSSEQEVDSAELSSRSEQEDSSEDSENFAGWGSNSENGWGGWPSKSEDSENFDGWGSNSENGWGGWPSKSEDSENFAGWGGSKSENGWGGWPSKSESAENFADWGSKSENADWWGDTESSRASRATASVLKAGLDAHNKYRKLHKAPSLKSDSALNKRAQKYADYLAKTDKKGHSQDRKGIGENIGWGTASSEEEAVKNSVTRWYNEIKDYNWKKPAFKKGTGHFTALVWKGTTHVGIGVAYSPKKKWYITVANYKPGGNMEGKFKTNVLPK